MTTITGKGDDAVIHLDPLTQSSDEPWLVRVLRDKAGNVYPYSEVGESVTLDGVIFTRTAPPQRKVTPVPPGVKTVEDWGPVIKVKPGTKIHEMFGDYGELLLVGTIEDGGAITDLGVGWDSLAHLNGDGTIMCYLDVIGTRDDIEYVMEDE